MTRRLDSVFLLFVALFVTHASASGQVDSCRIRQKVLWSSTTLLGGGSLAALATLWYRDHTGGGFHFHDDLGHWLQMDKAGHLGAAYWMSDGYAQAAEWACHDRRESECLAVLVPLTYLGMVELMDGFSAAWGASWGDLAANVIGSGMFLAQQKAWNEQRIRIKWSFHRTRYAALRPEVLGDGLATEVLKDYNGQTYWLSFNLKAIGAWPNAPGWLNLALGYGAEGMTGGAGNPAGLFLPSGYPSLDRRRQYYIAPDIDLSRIPGGKPWVKTLLRTFNILKIPLPSLSWEQGKGMKFHPLYF